MTLLRSHQRFWLLLGFTLAGCGSHMSIKSIKPASDLGSNYRIARLAVHTDQSNAAPLIDTLAGAISSELRSRNVFQRVLLAAQVGEPDLLIDVRVKHFHNGRGIGKAATWHLAIRLIALGSGEAIGHFEVRAGSDSLKSGKLPEATATAATGLADYLQASH